MKRIEQQMTGKRNRMDVQRTEGKFINKNHIASAQPLHKERTNESTRGHGSTFRYSRNK